MSDVLRPALSIPGSKVRGGGVGDALDAVGPRDFVLMFAPQGVE